MLENWDVDFKWDEFVDFYDKELVDNFGNFVNWVIVLFNKYFEGIVFIFGKDFYEMLVFVFEIVDCIVQDFDCFSFCMVVQGVMELLAWGNVYL